MAELIFIEVKDKKGNLLYLNPFSILKISNGKNGETRLITRHKEEYYVDGSVQEFFLSNSDIIKRPNKHGFRTGSFKKYLKERYDVELNICITPKLEKEIFTQIAEGHIDDKEETFKALIKRISRGMFPYFGLSEDEFSEEFEKRIYIQHQKEKRVLSEFRQKFPLKDQYTGMPLDEK